VPDEDKEKALNVLKQFNKKAEIIGNVKEGNRVILKSPYGSKRYIDLPKGELLPRIC
jgi:hydrogenase expression/formation protein HypE